MQHCDLFLYALIVYLRLCMYLTTFGVRSQSSKISKNNFQLKQRKNTVLIKHKYMKKQSGDCFSDVPTGCSTLYSLRLVYISCSKG